ncbi:MAG: hypothetical protein VKO21_00805 [Candidatus Sericytochromatia bacterium]|nr:hypothetical protein [Candidatus Sericytochromatia bacterium]
MSAEGDLVVNALVLPVGSVGVAAGEMAFQGGMRIAAVLAHVAGTAVAGAAKAGADIGKAGEVLLEFGKAAIARAESAWQRELEHQDQVLASRFSDRAAERELAIRALAHLQVLERAQALSGAVPDPALSRWQQEGERLLRPEAQGVDARLTGPFGALPALPDLEAWVTQMDDERKAGLEALAAARHRHLGRMLREALEASGYTIIRDEVFGEDLRISATRRDPRRRVVWRITPEGLLAFDVTEGYQGQECRQLLADVFDSLERRGVTLTSPRLSVDTMREADRILRDIGETFRQQGGHFGTDLLEDPGPSARDRLR